MVHSRWGDDPRDEYDDELDEAPPNDESSELIPCPECGAEIHEESQRCPACGTYVVHRASLWFGRPWWWVVLGALGIGAATLAMLLGS